MDDAEYVAQHRRRRGHQLQDSAPTATVFQVYPRFMVMVVRGWFGWHPRSLDELRYSPASLELQFRDENVARKWRQHSPCRACCPNAILKETDDARSESRAEIRSRDR